MARSLAVISQAARSTQPPALGRRFAFVAVPYATAVRYGLRGETACAAASCACCLRCFRCGHAAERVPSAFRTSRQRTSSSITTIARATSAARGSHVHQLARVAAPDVRVGAVRTHDRPAPGFLGLRRRHTAYAGRNCSSRCRANIQRVRDVPGHRAHVQADEPRNGPCRAERYCFRGGPELAAILPRQGRCPSAKPGVDLLQLSHDAALHGPALVPRGRAVFFETWMGGGLGRAQGGYDEMVFRAMVRDNAHFYDPLGLASRGTRSISSRGERYLTARASSPGSPTRIHRRRSSHGSGATKGASATGPTSSSRFRPHRSSRHGRTGSSSSTSSSGGTSPKCASTRSLRIVTLAGSPVGSVSRMYYDEATGILYGGFRYPGFVETWVR